jgi:hypothetical protein
MRLGFFHGLRSKGPTACLTLQALLALAAPARAQYVQIDSFEVTPFVGVRFAGTFDVRAEAPSQTQAIWKDASSYGLSAGVRFDDFSMIEFRWNAVDFDATLRHVIRTSGRGARRRHVESVSRGLHA